MSTQEPKRTKTYPDYLFPSVNFAGLSSCFDPCPITNVDKGGATNLHEAPEVYVKKWKEVYPDYAPLSTSGRRRLQAGTTNPISSMIVVQKPGRAVNFAVNKKNYPVY